MRSKGFDACLTSPSNTTFGGVSDVGNAKDLSEKPTHTNLIQIYNKSLIPLRGNEKFDACLTSPSNTTNNITFGLTKTAFLSGQWCQ